MGNILRLFCFSALLLPLFAADDPPVPAATANGGQNRNVLSNEGVVLLADAGYDEDFLVDIIAQKQTNFDITVAGLAYLANHGLSERIVRFMIANERKPASPIVRVEAPSSTSPMVAVRAKIVKQKVLVPKSPAAPAMAFAGTSASGPTVQAVPYPGGALIALPLRPAAPQPAPYIVREKHWFRNRWYIVSPSDVPSPMPLQGQYFQGGPQKVNYLTAR